MARNTSDSKRRLPLPVLLLLALIYLLIAGFIQGILIWEVPGLICWIVPLLMYVYFGFHQWRILHRYIKRRGKGAAIRAVIGVLCEIAFGLIFTFGLAAPYSQEQPAVLIFLFGIPRVIAPGLAVGGFICAILLIGSLVRRGADRRLEIAWLPAMILYVGLCVYVVLGVLVAKPPMGGPPTEHYRYEQSRVRSYLAGIQRMLDFYRVHHPVYPPPMSAEWELLEFSAVAPATGFVPFLLTTPAGCFARLPPEFLHVEAGSPLYRYATDGNSMVLIHLGPDGVPDCPDEDIPLILEGAGKNPDRLMTDWAFTPDCRYDASNGTLSRGDIIVIKP